MSLNQHPALLAVVELRDVRIVLVDEPPPPRKPRRDRFALAPDDSPDWTPWACSLGVLGPVFSRERIRRCAEATM